MKIELKQIQKELFSINFYNNEEKIEKENFREELRNLIKWDDDIGYWGYKEKETAINNAIGFIFGKKSILEKTLIDNDKILEIISNSILLCNKSVKNNGVHIFIFPTISDFTLQKLNGVCGFSPWKKTILIFINPFENWEIALKETICHEYSHTISHEFHEWKTLLDSIIFEGLAEHFRERIIGGKVAPWASALTCPELNEVKSKIIPLLNNQDFETYNKIFFGNEEFKQWTGYSLGYEIIKNFLRKTEIKNWNEILKKNPEDIFKIGEKND